MGVPVMTEEEIERIGLYVKKHIGAWLEEGTIIPFSKDLLFSERIVRVEEGIRHQGELMEKMLNQMDKRFEQVEKRFEQMQENMDKRFTQVDKRFEEIRQDMNSRFEQVDKRFSHLQWTMSLGFTLLAALMGIFNFY